jgi:hypothetical protein
MSQLLGKRFKARLPVNSGHVALALSLIIALTPSVVRSKQKEYKGFVLTSPVGPDSAVRIFYSSGDVVSEPLVFRPVDQKSPLLNTALWAKEGWTSYVTFDEMSQLMAQLAQLNLSWKESRKLKVLPFKIPIESPENVVIEVVSTMGTANTKLNPTLICERLKPLDPALRTYRALWELRHFRVFNGCQIPGFNFFEFQRPSILDRGVSH